MNYRQECASEFAEFIKSLGFKVYLAESGDYGFITDDKQSRVLSFSYDGSLRGNYGPPSTQSGTGWRMDESTSYLKTAEDVRRALYAQAPPFCGNGWKRYTTVEQYLAMYGTSSRYREV